MEAVRFIRYCNCGCVLGQAQRLSDVESEEKSSRANGELGGRPRKYPAARAMTTSRTGSRHPDDVPAAIGDRPRKNDRSSIRTWIKTHLEKALRALRED